MKSKMLLHSKGLHSNGLFDEAQQEIDQYLNHGYKVVSSQMFTDRLYKYIYTLLVKEDDE